MSKQVFRSPKMIAAGIFLVLSFFSAGPAQEEEVVQAKALLSADGVHPGDTIQVALLLKFVPTWHIHGHVVDDEFLIPTILEFEETETVKIPDYYYPEPKRAKYGYSEAELLVYEGEAILGALVKVEAAAATGEFMLQGGLRYQACNDSYCKPPKTVKLEIPLKIVPASQPTPAQNSEVFSKITWKSK